MMVRERSGRRPHLWEPALGATVPTSSKASNEHEAVAADGFCGCASCQEARLIDCGQLFMGALRVRNKANAHWWFGRLTDRLEEWKPDGEAN